MKKLLFVNACIREHSRTEALSRRHLDRIQTEYQIEELRLSGLDIKPFDEAALKRRDEDLSRGRFEAAEYRLAHRFAQADEIVIAAPYWDCLFPAILRVYLEHICVTGITFAYGADGTPQKMCQAERLTYITTCGGFLPKKSAAESLVREMGRLFSIDDVRFYAAEGLDVFPDKVQETLDRVLQEIAEAPGCTETL